LIAKKTQEDPIEGQLAFAQGKTASALVSRMRD
jgi:hypothetical protein